MWFVTLGIIFLVIGVISAAIYIFQTRKYVDNECLASFYIALICFSCLFWDIVLFVSYRIILLEVGG
jgi:hypothetical protein